MAGKKKINVTVDSNSWMSTYTDLMTLLLTFFVLLLSMSSRSKDKKHKALNSLVGAFGFKPGGMSVLGTPKGLDITTSSAPMVKEDIQFETLRNVALKTGLKSKLSISKQLDRTVIDLKNKVLFGENSATLKKESKAFLTDLAGILIHGPHLIELRGYVDSSECIMEKDPFKASMMLSSKRALAIFDFFVEKGIPSGDIVAHGFGLNYPGKAKESKKSFMNRQAEIILDYHERIPYRLRKPDRSGGFLDFKGFFFRTAGSVNGRR